MYNVKHSSVGEDGPWYVCFCCPVLSCTIPLPYCLHLHNVLFISVDELNDTIAANLNDTEVYGGELW